MPKKHFVFDFDDTIASSADYNQDIFVETFSRHQPDINEQVIREIHRARRGTDMLSQFQLVIATLELKLNAATLLKQNEVLQRQRYKNISIFAGVPTLFNRLQKNGKTVSVCSNRDLKSLELVLQNHDILDELDMVVSCHDAGFEKPNPQGLLDIMSELGGEKEEYIYFGDNLTDHEFARNAGIDVVIVDHYLNDEKFYQMMVAAFF